MPNIIDVIIHGKYEQVFVVLDRMPKFTYERRGNCLVAEDDGCYNTYYYERPTSERFRAFAGRKFDIPMKDGTVEKASGQWWDGKHHEAATEPIVDVGINTIAGLHSCYVFMSGHISKAKFDDWMSHNKPATNYNKYDKRRTEANHEN